MTTPQFDVFQQVFSLSQAANVLFTATGTQSALQTQAEKDLSFYCSMPGQPNSPSASVTSLIGDWSVVWGPVVWKAEPNDASSGPSNVVFVAHNPAVTFPNSTKTVDTYVVAVAATAVYSVFDIFVEDAGVSSVVSFDTWLGTGQWTMSAAPPQPSSQLLAVSGQPFIDTGTATGVWALLGNAPPQDGSAVGAGTYLAEFVNSIPSTSAVIVTGHSLGGALSPTLAMVLQQKGWLKGYQANSNANPSDGIVYVYPTAGASPGNPAFATLYNSTFPIMTNAPVGSSPKVWNALLYNTLDVVPHAWAEQSDAIDDRYLSKIPGLYGNPATSTAYIDAWAAVKTSEALELTTNCHYTPLQGNAFPGTFMNPVPSSSSSVTVGNPPSSFDGFKTEALYQHIAAYSTYTGITSLPPVTGQPQAATEAVPA